MRFDLSFASYDQVARARACSHDLLPSLHMCTRAPYPTGGPLSFGWSLVYPRAREIDSNTPPAHPPPPALPSSPLAPTNPRAPSRTVCACAGQRFVAREVVLRAFTYTLGKDWILCGCLHAEMCMMVYGGPAAVLVVRSGTVPSAGSRGRVLRPPEGARAL